MKGASPFQRPENRRISYRNPLLLSIWGSLLISTQAMAAAPGGVAGGLETWVKADAGITAADGAGIASWLDQSVNAYNFSQATSTAQPTYYSTNPNKLLNFNPSIEFDGTSDHLRNATELMASNSSYTYLAVHCH